MSTSYYVYFDQNTGKPYYYDSVLQTSTYEFPINSQIFEPNTQERLYYPGGPFPSFYTPPAPKSAPPVPPPVTIPVIPEPESVETEANDQQPASEEESKKEAKNSPSFSLPPQEIERQVTIDVEIPVAEDDFLVQQAPRSRASSLYTKSPPAMSPKSLNPKDMSNAAPIAQNAQKQVKRRQTYAVTQKESVFNREELLNQIKQFKSTDFAKQHFNKQKRGFFRKVIPAEDMVKFSTEPIKSPLLSTIPKKLEKVALKCYDTILTYQGVKESKRKPFQYITQLLEPLTLYEELRDEVYFQLIKQTTDVNDSEKEERGWELLLLVCSLYPATHDTEQFVKSHLAKAIQDTSKPQAIKDMAELSYLRFEASCLVKPSSTCVSPKRAMEIIRSTTEASNSFGVTIKEILWTQKHVKNDSKFPSDKVCIYDPSSRIPIVLRTMCETITKNGIDVEGIFRIPGNNKVIEKSIDESNVNYKCVESLALHDSCSLLKRWFAEIPGRLLSKDKFARFIDFSEQSPPNDDEILALFSTENVDTLLYLIGFLKEAAKYTATTKMDAGNLARVFAPNLYEPIVDPIQLPLVNQYMIAFLQRLIADYDTTNFYPICIYS